MIESNDADQPSIEIAINGEGADPELNVIPDCSQIRDCKGTATLVPPAIDFGEEPFQRAVEIPTTKLPSVTLINEGAVELVITRLALEGPDAEAFHFVGNAALPHQLPDGTPALILGPGEGQGIPIRFKPTTESQESYAAEVVIVSDDPAHAEVRVQLSGTLGENLPPRVCANIVRVVHPFDPLASYDTKQDWAPLLEPPTGGYDFSTSRNIQPNSTVFFSALSNSADAQTCTTDPEDQRQGLKFQWTLTKWPMGVNPPPIGGSTTATPSFTVPRLPPSVMQGEFELELTVTDSNGLGKSKTVPIRFAAVRREDLIVQLSWDGENHAFAGVDLDLHLVRPSRSRARMISQWFEGPGAGQDVGRHQRLRPHQDHPGLASQLRLGACG